MILSCNSCEKKFVVPDNAIGPNGRLVQCSSCGNKWKQFPLKKEVQPKEKASKVKTPLKKSPTLTKTTKRKTIVKSNQKYLLNQNMIQIKRKLEGYTVFHQYLAMELSLLLKPYLQN